MVFFCCRSTSWYTDMNRISANVKSMPAIMSEYEIQKLPLSPRRARLLRRMGYSFLPAASSAALLTRSIAF